MSVTNDGLIGTKELVIIFGAIIIAIQMIPYVLKMLLSFSKSNYAKMGKTSQIRLVRQLHEAVTKLSQDKTGAIITIERKQKLDNHRTDGVVLNSNINSDLLISLFNKNSPLHDGAVTIRNDKIIYAGTYYKITSKSVDNKYGARHRASLGIAEQSDSLTIVVSEESGAISLAKDGRIARINKKDFQEKLVENLN